MSKPINSTASVQKFRQSQKRDGAGTVYSVVDEETMNALDAILLHRLCSKRTAIETAIQRYAAEVTRRKA
jgi:hypothetical protein